MSKKFSKKIEDFTCGYCASKIRGNGFTNHCPNCLYSRHVDINPGDRQAPCKGLMRPIKLDIRRGGYVIIHCCEKCGLIRKNKASPNDKFENLLNLAKNASL